MKLKDRIVDEVFQVVQGSDRTLDGTVLADALYNMGLVKSIVTPAKLWTKMSPLIIREISTTLGRCECCSWWFEICELDANDNCGGCAE